MENIFGDNLGTKKKKAKKSSNRETSNNTEKTLIACFDEYESKNQELFKDLKSNTNRGQSFACFSTFVILHTLFKEEKSLSDISFFLDRSYW